MVMGLNIRFADGNYLKIGKWDYSKIKPNFCYWFHLYVLSDSKNLPKVRFCKEKNFLFCSVWFLIFGVAFLWYCWAVSTLKFWYCEAIYKMYILVLLLLKSKPLIILINFPLNWQTIISKINWFRLLILVK